ncbi:MAG: aspartate aminotransferase, partial [Nocardiaceae bacterium]|nr:aspartate aminotransferase [Nocardiaceae bacterium]
MRGESRRAAIEPFYVMEVLKAAADRALVKGDVLSLVAGQP